MEDKVEQNTHSEQPHEKKTKSQKNTDSLRELHNNMKHNNFHIIEIPEGVEKEQRIENLFEKIMTENFPNMVRKRVTQVQEAQKVPIKMNPKGPLPRQIMIKMARFKDKERILKAAREKQEVTYRRTSMSLAADLSMETLQARREWQKIFQVMGTRGLKPIITLPRKALN